MMDGTADQQRTGTFDDGMAGRCSGLRDVTAHGRELALLQGGFHSHLANLFRVLTGNRLAKPLADSKLGTLRQLAPALLAYGDVHTDVDRLGLLAAWPRASRRAI